MKECRYTVCRPVQETVFKTVNETVCRTVTETVMKETCEEVCVPRTYTKQGLPRRTGCWATEQVYVPGKTICKDGCVYQCPGTYVCKKVWVPQTVTENVNCTVYERQLVKRQCPVTVCRQVPETITKQVPVTTCRMVAQECVKQIPTTASPATSTRRMHPRGPRDHLRDGSLRASAADPRDHLPDGPARPAYRRPVPYTVCTMVPKTCTRMVPVSVTNMCAKTMCRQEAYTVTVQVPEKAGLQDGPVHRHPDGQGDRRQAGAPCTVTRMVRETAASSASHGHHLPDGNQLRPAASRCR